MQDIIEKLYNGEIYPAEKINPLLQDFKKKWHTSSELRDAFNNNLPEQLKDDFEALMLGELELTSLEMTQAFVDGYKLGAKFLIEVLSEDREDVKN